MGAVKTSVIGIILILWCITPVASLLKFECSIVCH